MAVLSLKPTHKAVENCYEALAKFEKLGVKHEGAVRSAFEALLQQLRTTGRRNYWAEFSLGVFHRLL